MTTHTVNTCFTNFLIKIDDDYKIITNTKMNILVIKKLFEIYYKNVELFPFTYETPQLNILSVLNCDYNGFLKINNLDPTDFIYNIQKLDTVLNYFKTTNLIKPMQTETEELTQKTSHNYTLSNKNTPISRILDINDKPKMDENLSKTLVPTQKTKLGEDISRFLNKIDNPKIEENIESSPFYYFNNADSQKKLDETTDFGSSINNQEFSENNVSLYSEFKPLYKMLDVTSLFHIYFNNQFNTIIIVYEKDDLIATSEYYSKLFPELISIYKEKINLQQYKKLNELTTNIFINLDEAKNTINNLLHPTDDIKMSINDVKELILTHFNIDTEPKHCIKFTNIYNIIIAKIQTKDNYVNYIKRVLPTVLADLNLQKKRLSDGMYWYGLVEKPIEKPVEKPVEKINESNLENDYKKLLKERENIYFSENTTPEEKELITYFNNKKDELSYFTKNDPNGIISNMFEFGK